MKKNLLFIVCFLITTSNALAQTLPARATGQLTLRGNSTHANILNGGDLFWDFVNGRFIDTATVGTKTTPITGLWIAGYENNNLKMAGQTYRQTGNDFWSGPLDNATGITDATTARNWDKLWHIWGYEVRQFIDDWNDNGAIDSTVANHILGFPARNNPYFQQENGFQLPQNQDFASFIDRNNDGVYNPMQGDYPIVPNTNGTVIPDDMIWTVFNDEGGGNVHTETHGNALKAEIQLTFYAFSYPQQTFLNNTIFANYKLINKSANRLDSVYVGLFSDVDLGCYNDDYIGCSPQNNTMYAYNKNLIDQLVCPNGGTSGYSGPRMPTIAYTFLDPSMTNFGYFINNTLPTPLPGMSNPTQATEYYNYMSGLWRDGTPLTIGNEGYNGTSTNFTKFAFPDNPRNTSGWSEHQLMLTPRDYRMVGTTHFATWQPMEAKSVTMAFSTHIDNLPTGDNLTSVDSMLARIPRLRHFFNNNYQAINLSQQTVFCSNNCVFPGDANNDGRVNFWDYLYPNLLRTQTGASRNDRLGRFIPTDAANWTQNLANNLNTKHLDCDGNGIINANDMTMIADNFGESRLNAPQLVSNPVNMQFHLTFPTRNLTNIDTLTQTLFSVSNSRLALSCDIPNNDFYAIAFTIALDDSVFTCFNNNSLKQPQLVYGAYKSIVKTYISPTSNRPYKWDIVMSPTDGNNTGTNSSLMTINLNNASNITNGAVGHINFSNVRIIKNDGSVLWNYGMKSQAVYFKLPNIATEETPDLLQESSVYPNPVENNLTIDLGVINAENDPTTLRLYGITGNLILTKKITETQSILDVSALSQGVYLVELSNKTGKITHRIVK